MARKAGKVKGVFDRDGCWWVRWTCTQGHEHREKVGPKGLAKERHAERRRDVREARRDGKSYCLDLEDRSRPVMFKDIAKEYLRYAEEHTKTPIHIRARLARLLWRFRRKPAADVTRQDVEGFKADLAKTRKPATVNNHLKVLSAIYNRAIEAGKVKASPMGRKLLLKENNKRNRYLTPEEEARLFEHLPEDLRPLVTVALHTGMRRGELLRLRWADVDFHAGVIHVREAKSGEGRSLAVNSLVLDTLKTWRAEQIRRARVQAEGQREILSPYVFCAPAGGFLHNLKRGWLPAVRAASIPDFRFHDLRHTFASRLVMAGVHLYTVQKAGGWASWEMVQRYAHLSQDHMREAVERLVPGAGEGAKSGSEPAPQAAPAFREGA